MKFYLVSLGATLAILFSGCPFDTEQALLKNQDLGNDLISVLPLQSSGIEFIHRPNDLFFDQTYLFENREKMTLAIKHNGPRDQNTMVLNQNYPEIEPSTDTIEDLQLLIRCKNPEQIAAKYATLLGPPTNQILDFRTVSFKKGDPEEHPLKLKTNYVILSLGPLEPGLTKVVELIFYTPSTIGLAVRVDAFGYNKNKTQLFSNRLNQAASFFYAISN